MRLRLRFDGVDTTADNKEVWLYLPPSFQFIADVIYLVSKLSLPTSLPLALFFQDFLLLPSLPINILNENDLLTVRRSQAFPEALNFEHLESETNKEKKQKQKKRKRLNEKTESETSLNNIYSPLPLPPPPPPPPTVSVEEFNSLQKAVSEQAASISKLQTDFNNVLEIVKQLYNNFNQLSSQSTSTRTLSPNTQQPVSAEPTKKDQPLENDVKLTRSQRKNKAWKKKRNSKRLQTTEIPESVPHPNIQSVPNDLRKNAETVSPSTSSNSLTTEPKKNNPQREEKIEKDKEPIPNRPKREYRPRLNGLSWTLRLLREENKGS
eukprot:TRINITY_DN5899_c0_g1_i1.p1 TRINITY_DN5899_c0_g1~~TRINITY_DN5899_c0_g1_i1.p1  ORF type:complete len:322 (+),score=78.85 TRINITY_DN5899_c0_g1_i1:26-991(+)